MTETASPSTSAISSLVQRFTEWERSADRELLPTDVIVKEHQKRVAGTDPAHVEEIAAAIRSGAKLPPVAVFLFECPETGRAYGFLADGYHRVEAARLLGHTKVGALVFRGRTEQDFHLYARWKNNANGKALSAKDAAAGIEEVLADPELSTECTSRYSVDFSTLAALVGVSETTARKYGKPFAAKLRTQRDEDILRAYSEGLTFRQISEKFGNEFDEKTARRTVKAAAKKRSEDLSPLGFDLSGLSAASQDLLLSLIKKYADKPAWVLAPLQKAIEKLKGSGDSYEELQAAIKVITNAGWDTIGLNLKAELEAEAESEKRIRLIEQQLYEPIGELEELGEPDGSARDEYYSKLVAVFQEGLDKAKEMRKKANAARRARKESMQPIANVTG